MVNFSKELEGQPIAIIDLETTGLNEKVSKILAIGAVKMIDGEIVDTFYSLVNVGEKLESEIVELVGITDDDLVLESDIKTVLIALSAFCKDCIIASHNLHFYNRFMGYNLKILDEPSISFSKKQIDIINLARRVYFGEVEKFSLLNLAKYLSIEIEDLDVKDILKISANILKKMLYKDITIQPLGVFWVKDEDIILENYIVREKKQVVNFYSHLEVYENKREVFKGKPYDYYPRGRIVFDEKKNKIVVFADKCIGNESIKHVLDIYGFEINMVEICFDNDLSCYMCK